MRCQAIEANVNLQWTKRNEVNPVKRFNLIMIVLSQMSEFRISICVYVSANIVVHNFCKFNFHNSQPFVSRKILERVEY